MNCRQIAKRKQAHAQHRARSGTLWSWSSYGVTHVYRTIKLDNASAPRTASLYFVDKDGATTLIAEKVEVEWTA